MRKRVGKWTCLESSCLVKTNPSFGEHGFRAFWSIGRSKRNPALKESSASNARTKVVPRNFRP